MDKEYNVKVSGNNSFADLSPVGTFVFCILCFCFWAADMGMLGEGSTLAIGLIGLAVFVPYVVAGVTLASKGIVLGGNTYMVFGAVFGACGGLFNTFNDIFAFKGIAFNYSVVGIAFFMGGFYLLCMLPIVIRATKIDFLIFLFGAIGCMGSGLTVLGLLPASFNVINGWALFIDGVVGFYSVVAGISTQCGLPMSMGKPFVK